MWGSTTRKTVLPTNVLRRCKLRDNTMEHTAATQNVPSALVHCGKARIYFSSSWRELEMWNRSEMNEKPETKSRLKSQPRRKELRSTIITIRAPARPFKKINTKRNPWKCQQILHTITTNTAPEEKSHLPLSRDLWALKLSNYHNPVYLYSLSGCQFPSVCPYGVAFFNAENHRTVIIKAKRRWWSSDQRQFHRWHHHHTYKELKLFALSSDGKSCRPLKPWITKHAPSYPCSSSFSPLQAFALSLTDMRKEYITPVLAR